MLAIGSFLLVTFLARFFFFIYNFHFWNGSLSVLYSFLLGSRLDLATILILESLLFIYWLLPVPYINASRWPRVSVMMHSIVSGFVLFVNFIDVAYYPFSEKRITYELFTLQSDVQSFSPGVLIGYGWMFLILGFVVWLNYKLISRWTIAWIRPARTPFRPTFTDLVPLALFLVLALLGIRGTGEKPLRPAAAFFGSNRFLGHVASNTAYNMIYSIHVQKPKPVQLVDETTALEFTRSKVKNNFDQNFIEDYAFHRQSRFAEPPVKKNIVLIVMESFNGEDTGILNGISGGESITPGFDRLAKDGALYSNYYANARRSIEAFPAILGSIPDLLPFPVIGSFVETNRNRGIGSILKELGYKTAFFHGGRNGTMGLEYYSRIAGFANYYGLNEYEEERGKGDYDGHWGIYDHAFFDYFLSSLKKMDAPFFSVIFSLSNHHPYTLPPDDHGNSNYIRSLPISPAKKTMMYADTVLADFMEKASHEPFFENTIFLITADHNTFEGLNFKRHIPDLFRVPFLIYSPGFVAPETNDLPASHVDIYPTILDLLHISTDHASMGRSMRERVPDRSVLVQESGMYGWMKNDVIYVMSFQGFEKFYRRTGGIWDFDQQLTPEQKETYRREFSSFYQEAHNSLVENHLLAPLENGP